LVNPWAVDVTAVTSSNITVPALTLLPAVAVQLSGVLPEAALVSR
jgi:hypothetical protein